MGKKLTHEQFLQKVFEKNEHVRNGDIEIRGIYINVGERIECHCLKHNVTWYPVASSLYKGIGCKECAKEGISEKNSKTHDEFVYEMSVLNEGIKILTQYTGMSEEITVELRCGHIWTTKAINIYYRDFGCPYCSGNAILVGFNDLWTTSPETAKMLTNPKDGYLVSKGSGQKKNFTCPLCNKRQNKIVKNVVNRTLQCTYCGDGVSFPNKFGRALLDQLIGDDYIPEYSPDWIGLHKYDNYFIYHDNHYVLEMDGGFHYEENDFSSNSLEERQLIDKLKDELANSHGINVIRIDCCESSCSYIVQNIMGSVLNEIFDLSNVDWQKCDMQAQKNLIKEACDLYMSGVKSTDEISKKIKVGRGTAVGYLKKGAEFGWCDYDPKKSHIGKPNKKLRKPVVVTNMQSGIEYYFDGVTLCEKKMFETCGIKVHRKVIYDTAKFGRVYKGFSFKYAEQTIQN